MKDKIITTLTNLIKIKSIVTLTLTAVFAILALRELITAEQFLTIFTMVIGFYFGTQKIKETEEDEITIVEETPVETTNSIGYKVDTDEWHES